MAVQTSTAPVQAATSPPPDEDEEKKPGDEEKMPDKAPDDKPAEPAMPIEPEKKPDEDEDEEVKPKLATIAELRAGIPGASDTLILKAFEKGMTLTQAQTAHELMTSQRPAPGGPGVPDRRPKVESADSTSGGDLHPFLEATRDRGREDGVNEAEARRRVAAESPDLYADWREAVRTNNPSKVKR